MSGKAILNVAGGKIRQNIPNVPSNFLVNVDSGYYSNIEPKGIESGYRYWTKNGKVEGSDFYCNEDIFEFLERSMIIFDEIKCYRFLEHVSYDKVLYFIYLLSTAVHKDGLIDVIVPNYRTLAKRILHENINDPNFERDNIITTTELLNERSEPHASIWTIDRAKHYFELEGRFEVVNYNIEEEFDGRNMYLRFTAKRL